MTGEAHSLSEIPGRPKALRVNPEGIPQALKEVPQWVLWKYTWVVDQRSGKGKWDKPPSQRTGAPASVARADTWCTYEQALEAYLDSSWDGIGLVLTEHDPLVGIDPDQCSLEAARPFLLETYTEQSPSGEGFRQILFADKPAGSGCKKKTPAEGIKAIEIYDRGRYLTITGRHVAGYPADVNDCQAGLESLCVRLWPGKQRGRSTVDLDGWEPVIDDQALLRIMFISKTGDKIRSLYNAEMVEDHSAADQALCNYLAFFTAGNALQMDSLFRESALMRAKWDDVHSSEGDTYGQMTIRKALEGTSEYFAANTPRPELSMGELEEMIVDTSARADLVTRVANAITDSGLPRAAQHALRKDLAKKAGTTIKALEEDALMRLPAQARYMPLDIARQAIDCYGEGNLIHSQNAFWAWRETGVWGSLDDQDVRQKIHQVMPDGEITGSGVDSVLKVARTEAFLEDAQFGLPFDGINCQNGELHYLEEAGVWELRPHRKDRLLISQIPVTYDPDATAPRFEQFLQEIFAGDEDAADKAALLVELLGYTLLTDCRYERFVILIGRAAAGKSKVLDIVEGLCGTGYISAVAPDKLDNSFQRAHLHGKYANLVSEIAEGAVVNDAALKAITSGELTTAEHKFRPPFSFHPYATCWFGTNHMPHTRDFSDALFRRAMILTFNNTFEGENRDPHLKGKLLQELPGILNRALEGLARVMRAGDFTTPTSLLEARREWRVEADQVRQFVEDCCALKPGDTPKGDLYGIYCAWCSDVGIDRRLKQKSFSNRLAMMGVGERKSGSTRFYTGVVVEHSPQGCFV